MIPVPAIEYVNVRIRAFHSRLFRRDTYEDLMGSDNLGALTTFLLDNPDYREDTEKALEGLPEREGLERGVMDYFVRCISNVLNMANGKTRHLFEIALSSFDIRNLRTILLAHKEGLPFHKVRDMLIPCGRLDRNRLSEIYNSASPEETAYNLPEYFTSGPDTISKTFNESTQKEPIVNTLNLLELNQYRHILSLLEKTDNDTKILREVFRFEIDLKNIIFALKFVWEGAQHIIDSTETFIPGGKLNIPFLHKMSQVTKLDEALEMVESTQFHQAVEKGIIYFAETGFFHEMERFFEEVFINKTQTYRRFHPFGIGVFIAYVWAHFVELTNLRTIINGIAFKTGAGQIRKGLIYL